MLVVSAGRRLTVYEVEPDALDALAPGRLIQRAYTTVLTPLRVLTVAAAGRGPARSRPPRGYAACGRGATTAGSSCLPRPASAKLRIVAGRRRARRAAHAARRCPGLSCHRSGYVRPNTGHVMQAGHKSVCSTLQL